MDVTEIAIVIKELVLYCAPAAFLINLTAWGTRVIIDAASGKGLKL